MSKLGPITVSLGATIIVTFAGLSGAQAQAAAGKPNIVLELMMAPIYAALMLAARGLPALLLYRCDLSRDHRIAVHRGLMTGGQGAALVGGGMLTLILYPALARPFLKAPATA